MNSALVARIAALAIAAGAIVDPSWTRMRAVPVPIAVIHDGNSAAFAAELRRELAPEFELVDGATPSAQATVLLRARDNPLPPVPAHNPVYVVDDPSRLAPIRIRSIDAPSAAILGRRVTVRATMDAPDVLGDPISIELRAGDDLVAREERPAGHRGTLDATLSFVPRRTGVLPLRLEAKSGAAQAQTASAVTVASRKLRVLFLDARPSWSSTFVRRALEDDPVFEVSTATTVSRGVAITSGAQTGALSAGNREAVDAIVAGTPSALSAGEISTLEAFARERGGAVILLADSDSAAALARFTGTSWTRRAHREPISASGAHGALMTSETLAPSAPAIAASELAPFVHEFIAGPGRIIVSGAIDAWRYRAAPKTTFGAFWRGVLGDAAINAMPPVLVTVTPRRANPRDFVDVEVVARGARPNESISMEGWIETQSGREPLRLWPAPTPGVFTARVQAPSREGAAHVRVEGRTNAGGVSAETAVLVAPSAPIANVPMGVPIVLMSARDGAYVSDGRPEALRNSLRSAFPEHRAPVTDHPMRYAWWIAPFTLLLGYEWRWRRQRGLK